MKASQRVLVNTVAQYSRTVVNMLLSLYTVRVVLASLGQSDYGIYTLIAGVVAMLGFITNSLVSTTQRFVSYYQGKGDMTKLKEVVNNSMVIHIIFGLFIVLVLEALSPLLFNGFLNIPEGRENAALTVYHVVAVMLFVTFLSSPYRALLVSRENIVYISIIDILDGILKVVLVILMAHSEADKLVFYCLIMFGLRMFNFLAFAAYGYLKYEECVWPNFKRLNKSYIKEISVFAGWKMYGTACIVGRDQGVSIVLNRVFGTIMNAGWGIGAQVSGYTNFLSSAIVNAMAPQIVKAEGSGDRQHGIWLSNVLSKLVFFLMSMIGIPMMFEVNEILDIWLENPPDNAGLFSVMFILALLFDSMTIGLTHINNAIGNIGKYIRVLNTPKLFTFVFVIVLLKLNAPLYSVCIVYVLIEAISAFVRIPMIHKQSGLDVPSFMKDVLLMELIPALLCLGSCLTCTLLFSFQFRFVVTFAVSSIIYAISMYYLGLTNKERSIVLSLTADVMRKIRLKK